MSKYHKLNMEIHFLNVGCGTMVLILFPDNSIFMYDCNITNDNEDDVISYLDKVIDPLTEIDVFINSHRDADHLRGIKTLHAEHPIKKIWDTGEPGTTTTSDDYQNYMDLRRSIPSKIIYPRKFWEYGGAVLRCMNSIWGDYDDPNDQSVVLKIEYNGSAAMLAGDTSFKPWKEKILTYYSKSKIQSDILLASHHGSLSFFDDPSDKEYYYTEHIKAIKPQMTIFSVGPNSNDLPNSKAVELYENNSTGSKQGNKGYSTEEKGNMKLTLKEDGGWSLSVKQ